MTSTRLADDGTCVSSVGACGTAFGPATMAAGASVGTGIEFEPGVGAAVGLGTMTGVGLAMDVVEGVGVDVAAGTGSCVAGTIAV